MKPYKICVVRCSHGAQESGVRCALIIIPRLPSLLVHLGQASGPYPIACRSQSAILANFFFSLSLSISHPNLLKPYKYANIREDRNQKEYKERTARRATIVVRKQRSKKIHTERERVKCSFYPLSLSHGHDLASVIYSMDF